MATYKRFDIRFLMNWEECPVLVTGGASFISSHLVDELVLRGAKVTVIDDLSNGRKENLEKSWNFEILGGKYPLVAPSLSMATHFFLRYSYFFVAKPTIGT